MIVLTSNEFDDGFHVAMRIHSNDCGSELAAILKSIEKEHPKVLAQALDYLMNREMEIDE